LKSKLGSTGFGGMGNSKVFISPYNAQTARLYETLNKFANFKNKYNTILNQ